MTLPTGFPSARQSRAARAAEARLASALAVPRHRNPVTAGAQAACAGAASRCPREPPESPSCTQPWQEPG